jgi:hypothetical protein
MIYLRNILKKTNDAMVSVYYMYLEMQCQSCPSSTSLFEAQGSDGIGFRNERNVLKSGGFHYDVKDTVRPYFYSP